ncbi:MAG: nitrilase-related carbon-nitrogen hydrolase, partial [Oscillospiraceae bacterium]|nr:nitrilase-related carbon-nitrogen hydrolase [Oscillospiraceae bacterium]
MFDYFRVACAVPDVEVADVDFNVSQAKKYIEKAKSGNVDLLVFPELGITGYTCADLFFQKTLLNSALGGIKALLGSSEGCSMLIAVGAPIAFDGGIYNCAVVISGGKII